MTTGGFLDATTTSFDIGYQTSGGVTLPINMPATTNAGDILIRVGRLGHPVTLPFGWHSVTGSGSADWKFATGLEGGTTEDWVTSGADSSIARHHTHVAILRFRFDEDFQIPVGSSNVWAYGVLTDGTKVAERSFTDNPPAGLYPYEYRLQVTVNTFANDNIGATSEDRPAGPTVWQNATEIYSDEVGPIPGDIGGAPRPDFYDLLNVSEQWVRPGESPSIRESVTLAPDGGQANGFQIRLRFPTPPTQCIEFEQLASGVTPDGGTIFGGPTGPTEPGTEAKGYIEAWYSSGLDSTPTQPADGALVLVAVSRYSVHGTVPNTGTLSGLGATWDLISSQNLSGGGASFLEVYRAQAATYTPGFVRYTFGAAAAKNGIFSTIMWFSFTGVDPAGLADNGASVIQGVDEFQGSGDSATYSAPALANETNLMFTAFVHHSISPPAVSIGSNPAFPYVRWFQSGRADDVVADPQGGEDTAIAAAFGTDFTWTWTSTQSWQAATVQMVADPECAGVLLPYWGILVGV